MKVVDQNGLEARLTRHFREDFPSVCTWSAGNPLRRREVDGQEGRLILKTKALPSKIQHMQSGIGELVFDVSQDQDGGFVAECLSESIVTEADTWQELRANVKEAVSAFFFDRSPPEQIRLHLVRDEVFTVS